MIHDTITWVETLKADSLKNQEYSQHYTSKYYIQNYIYSQIFHYIILINPHFVVKMIICIHVKLNVFYSLIYKLYYCETINFILIDILNNFSFVRKTFRNLTFSIYGTWSSCSEYIRKSQLFEPLCEIVQFYLQFV